MVRVVVVTMVLVVHSVVSDSWAEVVEETGAAEVMVTGTDEEGTTTTEEVSGSSSSQPSSVVEEETTGAEVLMAELEGGTVMVAEVDT